jgi:hypothetical protein
MRAQLLQRRAELQPPPPDKTDVAGAVQRAEMRTMLRGMANGARIGLLLSTETDPRLWASVLEAPNVMSGVTDEIRDRVVAASIEKVHPGKLAELEEVEDVIGLVDAAYRVALSTAQRAFVHNNPQLFQDFVDATVKAKAGAIDSAVESDFQSFGN